MRRKLLAALATGASLVVVAGAAGTHTFPDRIELPDGWQPEGIASGDGNELFVGSIPTGAVYRVSARTGRGSVAVPGGEGRAAIGLKADRRGRLFVAGGETGDAFVYDADDGRELGRFSLAPDGEQTFVNDVALTRRTAWFTDSRRPVLYGVATDLSRSFELALRGFELEDGFNLNGIVARRDGRLLLAVQTNTGRLWRIDPRNGRARVVRLGGARLPNGDGLLLHGRTLYVVQNQLNRVAVVRLDRRYRRGRVVRRIRDRDLDVPTTIARRGDSLYAVNARFGTTPEPDTEYWITRLRR